MTQQHALLRSVHISRLYRLYTPNAGLTRVYCRQPRAMSISGAAKITFWCLCGTKSRPSSTQFSIASYSTAGNSQNSSSFHFVFLVRCVSQIPTRCKRYYMQCECRRLLYLLCLMCRSGSGWLATVLQQVQHTCKVIAHWLHQQYAAIGGRLSSVRTKTS